MNLEVNIQQKKNSSGNNQSFNFFKHLFSLQSSKYLLDFFSNSALSKLKNLYFLLCEFNICIINNRDLQDGLVLLQLQNQVKPGCVDWNKVNTPPYKMAGLFFDIITYLCFYLFIQIKKCKHESSTVQLPVYCCFQLKHF